MDQLASCAEHGTVVVTISELGDKIFTGDARRCGDWASASTSAGCYLDAVIADLGQNPVAFWVVEAVATDGPITEQRREKLLAWAEEQNIGPYCVGGQRRW